jgi:bifunctional DNase/RNase
MACDPCPGKEIDMIMRNCHASLRSARAMRLTFALLLSLSVRLAIAAQPAQERVRIDEVEVAVSTVGPVVLLKAEARAIPVFVDETVAESIHAALTKRKLPRPLSHDLMHSILAAYDGKVVQAVVSLKGSTFYGELTIELAGKRKVFDSRSSDAIALAIHFAAPIWVSRELLEKSGELLDAPAGTQHL